MPEQQFHAREKVVEQMTRQGLVEENVSQETIKNVSSRQYQQYDYADNSKVETTAHDRMQEKVYYQYQQQNSDSPGSVYQIHEETEAVSQPVTQAEVSADVSEIMPEAEAVSGDAVTAGISEFSALANRIFDKADNAESGQEQPASSGAADAVADNLLERKIQRTKHERHMTRKAQDFDETDDSEPGSNEQHLDTNYSSRRLRVQSQDKEDKVKDKPERRGRLKFEDEDDKFSEGATYASRKLKRQVADEIDEDMDPEAKSMMRISRKAANVSSYAYNRMRLRDSADVEPDSFSSREKSRNSNSDKLKSGSRYLKEAEKSERETKERIKKSYQKKINQNRAIKEAQDIKHKQEFVIKAKEGVKRIAAAVKSIAGAVAGGSALVFILIIGGAALIIFAFTYIVGNGGSAYYGGLYQSTYLDISDCEAYFRELEIDLEEEIAGIEESEEYSGCDEYIYDLGDIGHNAVELMSYIATKYQDFTLEMCKEELKSLFEEKYVLLVEIKEEPRERYKEDSEGNLLYDAEGNPIKETYTARICYITLEVKKWDDIISEKLSEEEQERYDVYNLSQGGQQVYSNPLPLDWKNKISSRFGERIHPITKERSFHNGIDIAVPKNTPLYSATNGEVTVSSYSETAGNYIVVTMENGYSIKYMHLDSRGVSVGDKVTRGMLIGETGNTGRSTGPHLHVEVRTEDNKPIDPTFILSNGVGTNTN